MKIIAIFGTRPEAIKTIPVIKALKQAGIKTLVVSTGQHRSMLDQVMKLFRIRPDYDINAMLPNQTLSDISMTIFWKLGKIFEKEKPDLVLVQGDTATAFTSALEAFYHGIPVGHIEAGLRTYDKYNPFPEEINRQLIDIVCDLYFAPTKEAKKNLLSEGKPKDKIFVTGNTVIDAVLFIAKKDLKFKNRQLQDLNFRSKKIILVTCHRRESFGEKMESIFQGIRRIADEFENVEIVFPVHLNTNVQKAAKQILNNHPRIHLTKPFIYSDMVRLMKNCYFVVTDSGGLQEESPAFNKPVLVLRNETERKEGLKAGILKLIGTDEGKVYQGVKRLLEDKKMYRKMSLAKNPFGDGKASRKIVKCILKSYAELSNIRR